jgi:WD40 repeat protein
MTTTDTLTAATISAQDVAALGNVDDALAQFYADEVRQVAAQTGIGERVIRAWFEEQLLNEQGFRAQVLEGPGGDGGADVLRLLVDAHLLRTESRRGAVWYELAHDRLIQPVLDNNMRWQTDNLSPLQATANLWARQARPTDLLLTGEALARAEQWAVEHLQDLLPADNNFLEASRDAERQLHLSERASNRKRIAVLAAVVVVALAATSVVLLLQRRAKVDQQRSERLATESLAVLDGDPTEASRIALQAWDASHTDLAEEAVRQASSQLMVERGLGGHGGALNAVDLSSDGEQILTMSADNTARTWDSDTGATIEEFTGHTAPILGGRFMADDTIVVTWSEDHTIRSWDAVTGKQLAQLDYERWSGGDVDTSPHGRLVASTTPDFRAVVWDATTGMIKATSPPQADPMTAVAFDPADPDVFFTASDDSSPTSCDLSTVSAWSMSHHTLLASTETDSCRTNILAVTPDGSTVAAGENNGVAAVWRWNKDEEEPTTISIFDQSGQGVLALAFSPDGHSLVASAEKVSELYFASDDSTEWLYQGQLSHADFAMRSAIDPSGRFFVSTSRDGTAKVGDMQTGSLLADLRGHAGAVTDVAIAADGRIVTASEDGTARIWRVPSTDSLVGHTRWVIGLDLADDGRTAVSGGADGQVIVWDLERREKIDVIDQAEGDLRYADGLPFINYVAIDASGRYVAAAGAFGGVWIWDRQTKSTRPVAASTTYASGLDFEPGGRRLAIGTDDGVELWDWQSAEPAPTIATRSAVMVKWAPTGHILAGGLANGDIVLWDATSLEPIRTMTGHVGQVWDLAFSPDGRSLASAGQDRTARIWDVATGRQRSELLGHDMRLAAVAFSPSGQFVVTGDAEGFVGVWNAETGRRLSLTRTHGQSVNAIRVLPDETIVSASDDNAVRLRTCETCVPMNEVVAGLRDRLTNIPVVDSLPRPSQASIFAIELGSCIEEPFGDGDIERALPIDCSQAHTLELFAVFTLPDAADVPFPGDDVLQEQASDLCGGPAFEAYVGGPLNTTRYELDPLTQTEDSWDAGNRRVLCLLSDPDGKSTGSARGSQG